MAFEWLAHWTTWAGHALWAIVITFSLNSFSITTWDISRPSRFLQYLYKIPSFILKYTSALPAFWFFSASFINLVKLGSCLCNVINFSHVTSSPKFSMTLNGFFGLVCCLACSLVITAWASSRLLSSSLTPGTFPIITTYGRFSIHTAFTLLCNMASQSQSLQLASFSQYHQLRYKFLFHLSFAHYLLTPSLPLLSNILYLSTLKRWNTLQISTGFASWQLYCMAL